MSTFFKRLRQSFSVLSADDEGSPYPYDPFANDSSIEEVFGHLRVHNSKKILAPIKTRIAMDCAGMLVRHALVDKDRNFIKFVESELNDRLMLKANIDQTGRALIQDAVETMLETGACIAVPTETALPPMAGVSDVLSMRIGMADKWHASSVSVNVYNEHKGRRVVKRFEKDRVAIAYNPLFSVMNHPNSTLQMLIDKLAVMDLAERRLYSPKLDLLLQMPFSLKHEDREKEARRRVATLEAQLFSSPYGIAYVDANEKITQLNRPVSNSLGEDVKWLTETLHSQLGLTPSIYDGTASEEEVLLYLNRTVLPVLNAILESMSMTFFTRTAITQGNFLLAFPDLFKMASLATVAEATDKLSRNKVMNPNEFRAKLGLSKSSQEGMNENKNANMPDEKPPGEEVVEKEPPKEAVDGKK